jgi:hypothetical protein
MPRQIAEGYELDAEAHRIISHVADRRGMKKKEVVRRVLLWFSRQPDPIKTVALKNVDEGMESDYADALEQLADKVRQGLATIQDSGVVPPASDQNPPPPTRKRRLDR